MSDCPYYPCHKVDDVDKFICSPTTCYCDEYPCCDEGLGIMLYNGLWDCQFCIKPHIIEE